MGSRGRSIRLRIYVLVAIPLITMLALFGYVTYTSVTNWLNLDRAPNLINATSVPLTNFVNLLQTERRAAVVYLSQPTATNLATFNKAVTTTESGAQTLSVALNSSGTRDSTTPAETAAINKMTAQINGISTLRGEVTAKKLSPIEALSGYTNVMAGQGAVLQAELSSVTNASLALQASGLISAVKIQEDLSEQDAVLAGALASGSLTGADRVAFTNAVGRQQDDTLNYAALMTPAESATYNNIVNQLLPKTVRGELTTVQEAVAAGIPLSVMEHQGLNAVTWQGLTGTWLNANAKAGDASAATVLAANNQPALDAKRRVGIIATVGALGLILTLIVSLLLSRSINGRLNTLRRSALTLAHEQLPAVVARLRRGESVDVAAEAPPLRVGSDEIGQVGQAIDAVRQTAIRSAIDEAAIRQGVNDMFRNLARRNQSLLQRQLSVLDEMERRATDPDVLEDLFKMDHLTTRMRRHAEGLIILSGAPPGRSWSAPVKLIDVMRGAVAEVEDYARVVVTTQSRAALAGSAVTDLIHLLAELIENATSLSPPFTQVKVSGETVANGFAIEIEDRGLGMAPQRLHDLNDRLANPPDINPANTEQLGLFVVGQLAKRHGVRVMLRPSPYGGSSAIVLIPLSLLVEDGPAAITSGSRPATTADTPAGGAWNGSGSGYQDGADAAGGSWRGGERPVGERPVGERPVGAGAAGPAATVSFGNDARTPAGAVYRSPEQADPRIPSAGSADPAKGPIRVAGALRHPSEGTASLPRRTGDLMPNAADAGARRDEWHGAEELPVVTGVPVTGVPSGPAPLFDVFTPINRPEQVEAPAADAPYAHSYPDFTTQPAEASYVSPYSGNGAPPAGAYQQQDTYYQQEAGYQQDNTAYQQSAPYVGGPALGNGAGDGGLQGGGPAGSGDAEELTGLPRRVRQANLAPQLRASAAATRASSAAAPAANAASLDVMRSTLSAMQRGWQQGRSQAQSDTEGSDGN